MSSGPLPPGYPRARAVASFADLLATPLDRGVNALCWPRTLPAGFETVVAALGLAREQFLFCSDIVHQGTERLEVLPTALLDADTWFFWWD